MRQNDDLEPIKEEEKDVEMELELSDNEPASGEYLFQLFSERHTHSFENVEY